MEMNQVSNRIHPLMAGAAASVMLVSLLGAAMITGILPSSHATATEAALLKTQAELATLRSVPQEQKVNSSPLDRESIENKPLVHHRYIRHATSSRVAQVEPSQQYLAPQVYERPTPVAYNSPVGIGLGAIVGGLIGSQVGGGRGKTVAAIAGALGGGYIGNEIAKRHQ